MLTIKKSARFALEVNLTNTLDTGDKAHKQRTPLALKPRAEVLIRGISGPTKRTDVLQKIFFKKKEINIRLFDYVEVMQIYSMLL